MRASVPHQAESTKNRYRRSLRFSVANVPVANHTAEGTRLSSKSCKKKRDGYQFAVARESQMARQAVRCAQSMAVNFPLRMFMANFLAFFLETPHFHARCLQIGQNCWGECLFPISPLSFFGPAKTVGEFVLCFLFSFS